ncbi:MucR family transcriptional regulator [Methylobacterium sp. NPDC080182]|uniref:MucR family transcriptional regulator n=1 Tax=Methylobacterium sp. NPDC080182 TaxID=3390590 RepID=UPI003D05A629
MDEGAGTIEDRAVDPIDVTVEVVATYVAHNRLPVTDLPSLIAETHAVFAQLASERASPAPRPDVLTPAQIRASITPEALISFENGKPYRTLKRHLTSVGLTPETYRRKWGLPRDYPMTAPNYSTWRSALAKSFALGLPHTVPVTPDDRAIERPEAPRHRAFPDVEPTPEGTPPPGPGASATIDPDG